MTDLPARRLATVLALIGLLGCHHTPPETGPPPDPLDVQIQLAAERGRNEALENLRLASMALEVGDVVLAEQALQRATSLMTTFEADGEYAAWAGAESTRDWKGEPYEKMAAYLQLGVLLYRRGAHDAALDAFEQALLADTGTSEERFRSDLVPAWVLQALVHQAADEHQEARAAMDRGVDALWSRHTIDGITALLSDVQVADLPAEDQALARAVLATSASAGVTAHPRHPVDAVHAAVDHAGDQLLAQRALRKPDRSGIFADLNRKEFERLGDALPRVADAWRQGIAEIPPQAMADGRSFGWAMNSLLRWPPNVVLLIEWGEGPSKIRQGRYGQLLTFAQPPIPPPPAVLVDGRPLPVDWMDSSAFQATTRGGRPVDAFLEGKAVYKDAADALGWGLFWTGEAVLEAELLTGSDTGGGIGAALAAIGLAAMISAAATNPEADIRRWEAVPESWYLVTAALPPGPHELVVEGRTFEVTVPEQGQAVELISLPALWPNP